MREVLSSDEVGELQQLDSESSEEVVMPILEAAKKVFLNSLKYDFEGISREVVEAKFASITQEQLDNLQYWQNHGHELQVIEVIGAGDSLVLKFATCAEQIGVSHQNMNYEALLPEISKHGAEIMSDADFAKIRPVLSFDHESQGGVRVVVRV